MVDLTRRRLLGIGIAGLITAPAIVRAASIMKVQPLASQWADGGIAYMPLGWPRSLYPTRNPLITRLEQIPSDVPGHIRFRIVCEMDGYKPLIVGPIQLREVRA